MLQKCSYRVAYALFNSESHIVQKRGFNYISEIYTSAWECTNSDRERILQFNDGFHLFHEISSSLQNAILRSQVSIVEQELKWTSLIEKVLIVDFWVAYDCDKAYNNGALKYFAGFMGYYIGKKQNQERISYIWERLLIHLEPLGLYAPEKFQEGINREDALNKFAYAKSLIMTNMLDLLENSLYKQGLTHCHTIHSNCYLILALKVHCYLYYLSEYESTKYISNRFKNTCREFIRRVNVRRIFSEFICKVLLFNPMPYELLKTQLYKELESTEVLPLNGEGKICIMQDVIRDFTAFIVLHLYVSDRLIVSSENLFSDEDVKEYCIHYLREPDQTIRRLSTFLSLLDSHEVVSDDSIHQKAQEKFSVLENILTQRLKLIEIEEAREKKKKSKDCVESQKEMSLNIKNYIEEKFRPLISFELEDIANLEKFRILWNVPSDYTLESLVEENKEEIAINIFGNMCAFLERNNVISIVHRASFSNDTEYLEHLKNCNADLLLGSQWVYRTHQYTYRTELDEILSKKEKVFFQSY